MEGTKVPWTKNPFMQMLIAVVVVIPLVIGFVWYIKAHPQTDKIRAEDVALELLSVQDVADASHIGDKLQPMTVEFNDQFEDGATSSYKFATTRQMVYVPNGQQYLVNSLAMFTTSDLAKTFITDKAKGQTTVDVKAPNAESSVAYFTPASATEAASLTLRFTQTTLAAKVQVYDVDNTILTAADAQKTLGPIATALASKEHDHISTMIDGSKWFADETRNKAMQHLPESITGTTYLGTASMTQDEWGGDSGDFGNVLTPGFVSGALTRFKATARPAEAVEVSVLEFDTAEHATSFKDGLLNTGAASDPLALVTELALPDSMKATSAAATSPNGVELQSAQGKYVIDVFTFSPFGAFDRATAEKDLVTMSQSVLDNFKQ